MLLAVHLDGDATATGRRVDHDLLHFFLKLAGLLSCLCQHVLQIEIAHSCLFCTALKITERCRVVPRFSAASSFLQNREPASAGGISGVGQKPTPNCDTPATRA